jgi:hypothetical protein
MDVFILAIHMPNVFREKIINLVFGD